MAGLQHYCQAFRDRVSPQRPDLLQRRLRRTTLSRPQPLRSGYFNTAICFRRKWPAAPSSAQHCSWIANPRAG